MSLAEFLSTVVGLLDDSGLPYMLTGSIASAYYAVRRATQDLDVVIAADERGIERIVQDLLERNWYGDVGVWIARYVEKWLHELDLGNEWSPALKRASRANDRI